MSTISISTSNTLANLNGLLGLGPTEAILTADGLTGVTVDVDLGIASAFTIIGSPDSDVTINPSDESILPISVLSTLLVETNGADVTLDEGALASVGALSGTTIDINGGTFQTGSGLITASLLNTTTFGFGTAGGNGSHHQGQRLPPHQPAEFGRADLRLRQGHGHHRDADQALEFYR